jgi:hypothetical protein
MNNKQINMNIDIKETTPVLNEDNKQVFQEGMLFRKVSRFLSGTEEDSVISIPCFFDPTSGKVLIELLPKEIREEYKEYNNSL